MSRERQQLPPRVYFVSKGRRTCPVRGVDLTLARICPKTVKKKLGGSLLLSGKFPHAGVQSSSACCVTKPTREREESSCQWSHTDTNANQTTEHSTNFSSTLESSTFLRCFRIPYHPSMCWNTLSSIKILERFSSYQGSVSKSLRDFFEAFHDPSAICHPRNSLISNDKETHLPLWCNPSPQQTYAHSRLHCRLHSSFFCRSS